MHPDSTDWVNWHEPYADDTSSISRRLRIVQAHLRDWLNSTPLNHDVHVLSLCAGDGRDLLEVLADRPDAARVNAVLIEITGDLVDRARAHATAAGLQRVQVRIADAGRPESYADCVGADLILLCGLFGNISDHDVHQTIAALPMLCAQGARVIWTRHRNEPDLTHSIRAWLAEAGFVERSFAAPKDARFTVGVHDLVASPSVWAPPDPLFTFIR